MRAIQCTALVDIMAPSTLDRKSSTTPLESSRRCYRMEPIMASPYSTGRGRTWWQLFYHELQETRTDSDVEEAIRTGNNAFLGWTSRQGEECGDFPVFEAKPLTLVFQEVSLAKGGTGPVQFQYSNAVHGPEG